MRVLFFFFAQEHIFMSLHINIILQLVFRNFARINWVKIFCKKELFTPGKKWSNLKKKKKLSWSAVTFLCTKHGGWFLSHFLAFNIAKNWVNNFGVKKNLHERRKNCFFFSLVSYLPACVYKNIIKSLQNYNNYVIFQMRIFFSILFLNKKRVLQFL